MYKPGGKSMRVFPFDTDLFTICAPIIDDTERVKTSPEEAISVLVPILMSTYPGPDDIVTLGRVN